MNINHLDGNSLHNWTLCVGAGICKGILPDWYTLTNGIVNNIFGYTWDKDEFKAHTDEIGFSLESWIQGCLNQHLLNGGSIESFYKILEEELYRDLLEDAQRNGILETMKLCLGAPGKLDEEQVVKICGYFEKNHKDTSIMQLVTLLLEPKDTINYPDSIITFNADSLLYSLLTVFKQRNDNMGKRYKTVERIYKKITDLYQTKGKFIPIYHLHGSIAPFIKTKKKIDENRDNLIFLERSYTQMAGRMFSWAQTNFLYYAQTNRLIFAGLSMSDQNIRKWLSWTAEKDKLVNTLKKNSFKKHQRHFWLRTKPSIIEAEQFLNVSLNHMGVKPVYIPSWGALGNTLREIIKK